MLCTYVCLFESRVDIAITWGWKVILQKGTGSGLSRNPEKSISHHFIHIYISIGDKNLLINFFNVPKILKLAFDKRRVFTLKLMIKSKIKGQF